MERLGITQQDSIQHPPWSISSWLEEAAAVETVITPQDVVVVVLAGIDLLQGYLCQQGRL